MLMLRLDTPRRRSQALLSSLTATLTLLMTLAATPASAQHGLPEDRFTFNFGALGAAIDSQLRLDSSFGPGTDVDVEDDLGLDQNKVVIQAEGIWWLTRRQRISAAYVDISRGTAKALVPRTIQIGEKTFQLNTEIESYVDTRYLAFRYGYSFIKTPTWELGGFLGLDAVRFRAGIDASVNGVNRRDGNNDGEFVAPVPEFGGFFALHMGEVTLSAQANYFGATIKDIKVSNTDARAGLTWRPWQHVGFGGGILFDRLTAEADKRLFDGRAADDFVGPEFYLQLGW